MSEFSPFAPSAPAVFYRSYSRRKSDGSRESFNEAITRTVTDIARIGKFTEDQTKLCLDMALKKHCFPSGRALWVAGTEWSKKPENYPGYYNCCSLHVDDTSIFGLLMELAMMGTGTGAVLEEENIDKLPKVKRSLFIEEIKLNDGSSGGDADTEIIFNGIKDENPIITIKVGDSREGWASAYQGIIELAMGRLATDESEDTSSIDALVTIDLSHIRQAGEPLKGFGGTANPVRLQETIERAIKILGNAVGRKLTPIECCLLIDEAASAVVAGNIRRSAGMRQFSSTDLEAANAKDNLYTQDASGKWSVNPDKEALRMANHTRCFHHKPNYHEIKNSVTKQFWSGEGAIQYVPEMIARANSDILSTPNKKQEFLFVYANQGQRQAKRFIESEIEQQKIDISEEELNHRLQRYGLNPCVTGDTKILTATGVHTIKDIVLSGLSEIDVWAYDHQVGRLALRRMENPRMTSEHENVVQVTFSNNLQIKCTKDHKFVMPNGTTIEAQNMKTGTSIRAITTRLTEDQYSSPNLDYLPNLNIIEMRVANVTLMGIHPVYNGTVDEFHNYIIVGDIERDGATVFGVVSANCGEIALKDNLCNLSEIHLNTIDPANILLQEEAFYAGGLQVAALLQHEFTQDRLNYSRTIDPIVGVSFTGLFDFFVHAFGVSWLDWMMKGCPTGSKYKMYTDKEARYLHKWRKAAENGVKDYCEQHGIRMPNRFTTVQPAGSKSLLTGASPGWHPPKAQRFIRRITFGVNDPLVSALRDYGYNVIPAQSARDEQGNLLDDISDPRVQEVLVEIPTEVSWANIHGCDQYDLSKLPIESQWRLYMQVQNIYTTHNTSATLEFRENEIDTLSELIFKNIQENNGYISAALLARFDANETFPRLPFEPITKDTYERRMAVVNAIRSTLDDDATVLSILEKYDNDSYELKGAAGCDSDKCLSEQLR